MTSHLSRTACERFRDVEDNRPSLPLLQLVWRENTASDPVYLVVVRRSPTFNESVLGDLVDFSCAVYGNLSVAVTMLAGAYND